MNNVDKSGTPSRNLGKRKPPARTKKGRENQLINLAVDLAEKKLRDGTASSQLIVLLLNLATTKNDLEMEKLRSDLKVADAKIKMLESQETSKELYSKAIEAFKSYSGFEGEDYDE